MPDADYNLGIESWRASLEAEIRRDDGPVALVGLFWLQDGVNTVGSSRDCTFCLRRPAPRLIGAFDFHARQLKFRADLGQVAEVDGRAVAPGASSQLRTDTAPSQIRLGEITMVPIEFGGRIGVQVWDRSRLMLADRPIRNWFGIDNRFRVVATYTPYPTPVKISIPDNFGAHRDGYAQGYVSFKLEGKSHNLDASETDDGRLLLQFRDSTNGVESYADGRYLLSELVSEDGNVSIDFNRAHNPPSAFSPFLPSAIVPQSHTLKCRVEAGERAPTMLPESD
jgi:uncharacterized protein